MKTQATEYSLRSQFRRHLPRYALGIGFLASYQFAQYLFDMQLMKAINHATSVNRHQATTFGLWLVLIATVAFGLRVASRFAIFNSGRLAEYELRKGLIEHLHRLGPSFYSTMSSGEIMSRATNDLQHLRLLMGFGVLNTVNTVFALISALSVMLVISWKLTAASFATLPVLFIVMRIVSRRMFNSTRANQDALGRLSDKVQNSLAGIRLVRIYNLEKREMENFERINSDYLRSSLSLARIRGSLGPIIQTLSAIGVVIVLWYGGNLILQNKLSTGGLLAFFRAVMRLTWPLTSMGFIVAIIQRGRAAYSRVREVMQKQPEIVDGTLSSTPKAGVDSLEVRNLSFAFDENPVLNNVSFVLESGQSMAIMGRTGAGKSTLGALLARLLPTPSGSVFIGGQDICDLPLHTLRRFIGYAQQQAFLFSTSVSDNIGYTLPEVTSAQAQRTIGQAVVDASIAEEVESFPKGLDTLVGERGVQLSGGQQQRIALARALVYESPILVLDDPLSAVDARTEHHILDALKRRSDQQSLILITNRIAASRLCDRVLVLDRGEVVEQGTPQQLLAQRGLYCRLAENERIQEELERLGTEPVLEGAL